MAEPHQESCLLPTTHQGWEKTSHELSLGASCADQSIKQMTLHTKKQKWCNMLRSLPKTFLMHIKSQSEAGDGSKAAR